MSDTELWLGIDPGAAGGAALLERRLLSPVPRLVAGVRMPVLDLGRRKLVDLTALEAFVEEHAAVPVQGTIIEAVHAMPRQGVSSTFTFGRHTGAVEAWALTLGPVHWVSPSMWKKHFGLAGGAKRQSLAFAKSRFGDGAGVDWSVLANEGVAEAALLAAYWLNH